jgi:RNA polymerase sigma factor (sigma-70 family)
MNRTGSPVVYPHVTVPVLASKDSPPPTAELDRPPPAGEGGPPPGEGPDDLYRRMWPGMVRLAHLLTGSAAAGEDLAQEAFVGLLRNAPVDAPEAYVRRSLVNLAINRGRRAGRERNYVRALREETADPPGTDDLWPLVQRLPVRQRAVIVLRYYLDLSEADIALALGCRPGTVKSTASHALAQLRKEIRP